MYRSGTDLRTRQPIPGDTVRLPHPCGPMSAAVAGVLCGADPTTEPEIPVQLADPLSDDDLQLALWTLYELHYRGLAGVDDRWEWHPDVLRVRAELEAELEDRLLLEVGPVPMCLTVDDVLAELDRLAAGTPGAPSVSGWVLDHGSLAQLREFAVHRSIYQLKEADPHTFGIPRLTGVAKAAMVEIKKGVYVDVRL